MDATATHERENDASAPSPRSTDGLAATLLIANAPWPSLSTRVEDGGRRVLGLGGHDVPHLRLRHRVHVFHVLAEILDGAADLLTAGTRGHALVDLHVAQQRHAVLVLPEADAALVRISTCKEGNGEWIDDPPNVGRAVKRRAKA